MSYRLVNRARMHVVVALSDVVDSRKLAGEGARVVAEVQQRY
jgi:hypothetical protein